MTMIWGLRGTPIFSIEVVGLSGPLDHKQWVAHRCTRVMYASIGPVIGYIKVLTTTPSSAARHPRQRCKNRWRIRVETKKKFQIPIWSYVINMRFPRGLVDAAWCPFLKVLKRFPSGIKSLNASHTLSHVEWLESDLGSLSFKWHQAASSISIKQWVFLMQVMTSCIIRSELNITQWESSPKEYIFTMYNLGAFIYNINIKTLIFRIFRKVWGMLWASWNSQNFRILRKFKSSLPHLWIHSLHIHRASQALTDAMVYQIISNNRKEQALYLLLEEGWEIERVVHALVLVQSIKWEENYTVHSSLKPPGDILGC